MILLCYDGSEDAKAAIAHASEYLGQQPAVVLTVWEGLADVLARTGGELGVSAVDVDEVDTSSERGALEMARQGVELARSSGLQAEARVVERNGAFWETILDAAEELGANAILLGTRGLTGIKSLVNGSVSGTVLQHADRPVIIVPSPEVAAKRAAHRRG